MASSAANNSNSNDREVMVPEINVLFNRDPYLKLHEREIRRRYVFLFISCNVLLMET